MPDQFYELGRAYEDRTLHEYDKQMSEHDRYGEECDGNCEECDYYEECDIE